MSTNQVTFQGEAILRGFSIYGEEVTGWTITLSEYASEVSIIYGPPGTFVFTGEIENGRGVFAWWPVGGKDPRIP